MLSRNLAYITLLAASVCSISGNTRAQDASVQPHVPLQKTIGVVTPTGPVPGGSRPEQMQLHCDVPTDVLVDEKKETEVLGPSAIATQPCHHVGNCTHHGRAMTWVLTGPQARMPARGRGRQMPGRWDERCAGG